MNDSLVRAEPSVAWSRARLLRELRRPSTPFRWAWITHFLWPLAAVFGALSYRGFIDHAWPSLCFGSAFLSFNFAVSAVVHQALAPLRRKVDLLVELFEEERE